MKKMFRKPAIRDYIGMLLLLVFLSAGCSTWGLKKSQTPPKTPDQAKQGDSPLYYDFGDVLIPGEMTVNRDASFVYRTSNFSAGVLVLKGRVELNSLVAFFENNMIKDNWQLISSFKSPRTLMLFHKENRWCIINISEKEFSTHSEIWVSPTTSEPGLLK